MNNEPIKRKPEICLPKRRLTFPEAIGLYFFSG